MLRYGLLIGALALAACTAAASDGAGSEDQGANTIDRLILGQASDYKPDLTLAAKSDVFAASMSERRKMAWDVIQRVVDPVAVDSLQAPIPRFQTWYSQEEILPMFDRLFRGLSPADQKARAEFTTDQINAVFPWNVTRATSLASFTQERLNQRKAEMATQAGEASLGLAPRVLMSPDYVTHLFQSYNQMFGCKPTAPVDPTTGAPTDPTSSEAFAPCLNGEFAPGSVAVKSRWMPDTSPVPVYDTSAASIQARVSAGNDDAPATYSDQGDSQANPTSDQAYTMQLNPTTQEHLVALHIITKELRDWVWITMWWSPDPNSDFGADRPASLTGIFANYKMCVVTAYGEGDQNPGNGMPQSLADAIAAGASGGPATWCSNPYLETADHAAKTNCIGCHQNGGTGETTDTILAQDAKFLDNSRTRVRPDFPADYAFTTTGGLDITDQFLNRVKAVSP